MSSDDYIIQAEEFLEKTNSKLEIKFKKFDFHFEDDENKRNIWECTLSNPNGFYRFDFGDSIINSCKESTKLWALDPNKKHELFFGIKAGFEKDSIDLSIKLQVSAKEIQSQRLSPKNMSKGEKLWNDEIKKLNSKARYIQIEAPSFKRIASNVIINKFHSLNSRTDYINEPKPGSKIKPSVYSILSCLDDYGCEDFIDFCACFGYNEDSIKAHKIWLKVQKEQTTLREMYSEQELQLLREIC